MLDRSFISEMVYGPVIRNKCKLSLEDYTKLLIVYKNVGTKIIYLTAPKDVLLKRRTEEKSDYEIITNYYEELNKKYDEIMEYSSKFIDIIDINTYEANIEQVRSQVKKLMIDLCYVGNSSNDEIIVNNEIFNTLGGSCIYSSFSS